MSKHRSLVELVQQGGKFGVVGLLATATHVGMMIVLVEWFHWRPLTANFGAFSIAFIVSFFGHYRWTFANQAIQDAGSWRRPFARFIVTSLIGLALNSLAVFAIVDVAGLSYVYALAVMVSLVPGVLFVIGKFWAFA